METVEACAVQPMAANQVSWVSLEDLRSRVPWTNRVCCGSYRASPSERILLFRTSWGVDLGFSHSAANGQDVSRGAPSPCSCAEMSQWASIGLLIIYLFV